MDSHDTVLTDDVQRCDDDQLIALLRQTLRQQRGMTARLVAFIAEVDARGLYRDHAHSSIFDYAVHALRMSEMRPMFASMLLAKVEATRYCSECWRAVNST